MRVLTPGCIWNKLAMNNFIYYLCTEIRGLWRWYRYALISNLRLSVSCIIMNTPPPPSSPLLHKHTSKIQNICGFCFFTSDFFLDKSVRLRTIRSYVHSEPKFLQIIPNNLRFLETSKTLFLYVCP